MLQEKNHLVSTKTQLEKDYSELEMKFIRANAELEIERKSLEEVRERLGREERERSRVGEELKVLSLRYSELLGVRMIQFSLATNYKKIWRGNCKSL